MNAFQTPSYQAVVQDLVPVQQRGIVSSVVNSFGQFGALLGGVYGLFLGTYLSTQSVYFILVGFYLVMLTISMLSFRERVQKPKERSKYDEIDVDVREYKPKNIGTWLKSFFYPMKSANFRWFLVMVFLNNCGDSLFRSFLQYYYLDSYKEFDFFGVLTFSRATAASGFSSVVMYSCAVCMSLASQWISKRVGRRVMSSFAQLFFLTAPIVLMLTQSFTLDIFMFIVYGIGYGMYNGVLWAFVADVVDDLFANSREDEHALISNAKDMGLWQTISLLSKVVVPGFGGFLLDTFQTIGKENNVPRLGYICIYSLAAFIFIMSGLAALKIKVKDKDQPKH
jgi:MFS family permease